MSYQDTTLIARKGYGSMGADAPAICRVNDTTIRQDGKDYTVLPAQASQFPQCSSPGTISQIGSFISGLLGGALNAYGQAKANQGAAQAYQNMQPQSTTPSWVMPVAIGAVGLTAVVLLTRKRSNPARRRRRR